MGVVAGRGEAVAGMDEGLAQAGRGDRRLMGPGRRVGDRAGHSRRVMLQEAIDDSWGQGGVWEIELAIRDA